MTTRTFAEIKKTIGTVMTSGAAWQSKVQQVAIEALQHSIAHREVSLLCMIYDRFPAGAKASAFQAWLESQGLIAVNKANKVSVKFIKEALDTKAQDAFEEMAKVNWYECKAPKKDPVYSTDALVKKLKAVVAFAKDGEEAGVAWGSNLLNLIHAIEQQIPQE